MSKTLDLSSDPISSTSFSGQREKDPHTAGNAEGQVDVPPGAAGGQSDAPPEAVGGQSEAPPGAVGGRDTPPGPTEEVPRREMTRKGCREGKRGFTGARLHGEKAARILRDDLGTGLSNSVKNFQCRMERIRRERVDDLIGTLQQQLAIFERYDIDMRRDIIEHEHPDRFTNAFNEFRRLILQLGDMQQLNQGSSNGAPVYLRDK